MNDPDDWISRQNREAFMQAVTASSRRERRVRLRNALAVVKAARKAGLPVAGADVEGVRLRFGEQEPAKAGEQEPPRVALFQTRTNPKMKVVL